MLLWISVCLLRSAEERSQNRELHVTTKEELAKGVSEGQFATVEICEDDHMEQLKADEMFAETRKFDECTVYRRFAPKVASQSAPPEK
jgi:hypothetical protein